MLEFTMVMVLFLTMQIICKFMLNFFKFQKLKKLAILKIDPFF